MRVQVQKGLSGTEVRDPGFNPRSIAVIIQLRIIIKHHALSKALGKGS
jgi:hypothetical protein